MEGGFAGEESREWGGDTSRSVAERLGHGLLGHERVGSRKRRVAKDYKLGKG